MTGEDECEGMRDLITLQVYTTPLSLLTFVIGNIDDGGGGVLLLTV